MEWVKSCNGPQPIHPAIPQLFHWFLGAQICGSSLAYFKRCKWVWQAAFGKLSPRMGHILQLQPPALPTPNNICKALTTAVIKMHESVAEKAKKIATTIKYMWARVGVRGSGRHTWSRLCEWAHEYVNFFWHTILAWRSHMGITKCSGARVNCQTHGVCVISSNLPQSMQWLLTTEMNWPSCYCCYWKNPTNAKGKRKSSNAQSSQFRPQKCQTNRTRQRLLGKGRGESFQIQTEKQAKLKLTWRLPKEGKPSDN